MGLLDHMGIAAVVFKDEAEHLKISEGFMATEELDEQLRLHRPRAGQIEEGIRRKRSVQLVCQKRRMENHLRTQTKAVEKKHKEVENAISQEKQNLEGYLLKLKNQGNLIKTCKCLRALNIHNRELEKFGFESKYLKPACERLSSTCKEAADKMKALNSRFDLETLKGPEDGGDYSQENIEISRHRLSEFNAKLDSATEQLLKSIKELHESYRQQVFLQTVFK